MVYSVCVCVCVFNTWVHGDESVCVHACVQADENKIHTCTYVLTSSG